jgi:hypothetical protein
MSDQSLINTPSLLFPCIVYTHSEWALMRSEYTNIANKLKLAIEADEISEATSVPAVYKQARKLLMKHVSVNHIFKTTNADLLGMRVNDSKRRRKIQQRVHSAFVHHVINPSLQPLFPGCFESNGRPRRMGKSNGGTRLETWVKGRQELIVATDDTEEGESTNTSTRRSSRLRNKSNSNVSLGNSTSSPDIRVEVIRGSTGKRKRWDASSAFSKFVVEIYNDIVNNLQVFEPSSPDATANILAKVPVHMKGIRGELTAASPNLFLADPRYFVDNGATKRSYTQATKEYENPIFVKVLEQEKAGKIAKIDIVELPKVGTTMVIAGVGDSIVYPKGTVLMSYQGEHMLAMNAPSKGEDGYDKLVTILQSKQCEERDIVIHPHYNGNLAQFASTCSPLEDDFKNMNAIVVMKDVTLPDKSRAVIPFLIAVQDLRPGDVVTWFYSEFFDWSLNEKWFTQSELQELATNYLNTRSNGIES